MKDLNRQPRQLLRVGEAAEILGISKKTLLGAEKSIPPTVRTDGGHRLYSRSVIERLIR